MLIKVKTKESYKEAQKMNISIKAPKSLFEQFLRDHISCTNFFNLHNLLNLSSPHLKGKLFSSPEKASLEILYEVAKLTGFHKFILVEAFDLAKENVPSTLLEEWEDNYSKKHHIDYL